ncbi:DUF1043 family protein [Blochmannia endosymbiont of Colobopsis nipponica]|uniref:ZapG family protein n=1 Tax=Blochmannia endosymbiont of Colobopsis nipponica TaxID=2681987 RepID=UPI001784095F|nr:DUF1043 family protein [Blochmannia endosymbiont of Colobopsis nipponica]QOI10801.1 DUF1043 family protein [Blochmannia endosymbiont of Colobopsis nipponica]
MVWKYILMSFICGITIGIIIMWFKKRNITQKQSFHNQDNKHNYNERENKLINHFINTADLLNDITQCHCKFYKYMSESAQNLLKNHNVKKDLLNKEILSKKINNDIKNNNKTPFEKTQPRDYSER